METDFLVKKYKWHDWDNSTRETERAVWSV